MRYFMTHIPRSGYCTAAGKTFKFETIDHTRGYLATEDAEQLAELDNLIKSQRGGVEEITDAVYNAEFVEKKRVLGVLPVPSREELSAQTYAQDTLTPTAPIQSQSPFTPSSPPAAPAVAEGGAPAEVALVLNSDPLPAAKQPEARTVKKSSVAS